MSINWKTLGIALFAPTLASFALNFCSSKRFINIMNKVYLTNTLTCLPVLVSNFPYYPSAPVKLIIQSLYMASTACAYFAIETKSLKFIIPAMILGTGQIMFSYLEELILPNGFTEFVLYWDKRKSQSVFKAINKLLGEREMDNRECFIELTDMYGDYYTFEWRAIDVFIALKSKYKDSDDLVGSLIQDIIKEFGGSCPQNIKDFAAQRIANECKNHFT